MRRKPDDLALLADIGRAYLRLSRGNKWTATTYEAIARLSIARAPLYRAVARYLRSKQAAKSGRGSK